jgi:hypothetical protein
MLFSDMTLVSGNARKNTWQKHSRNYPTRSAFALELSSVSSTSTPSERSKLNSTTAEQTVLLAERSGSDEQSTGLVLNHI